MSKQNAIEKRREQNRLAQRKFRARQEAQLRDLQEQVAALQQTCDAATSDIEHKNQLINSLRLENERLRSSSFKSRTCEASSLISSSSSTSAEISPLSVTTDLPLLMDYNSVTSADSISSSPILYSPLITPTHSYQVPFTSIQPFEAYHNDVANSKFIDYTSSFRLPDTATDNLTYMSQQKDHQKTDERSCFNSLGLVGMPPSWAAHTIDIPQHAFLPETMEAINGNQNAWPLSTNVYQRL